MKKMSRFPGAMLAVLLAACLAACQPQASVDTGSGKISSLGDSLTLQASGYPKARINAAGDLIIDGKTVALNAQQRALVTAYHHELQGVALAGMEIGKQGAKVAGKAVGAAIGGILSGNTDDIDAKVRAETDKIEAEARRLCSHLTGVRTAQDALAAQVPQFRPYANLDQQDIDDCGKD